MLRQKRKHLPHRISRHTHRPCRSQRVRPGFARQVLIRPVRKVCDLATYLRERRWERFATAPKATGGVFHVKPRTPQAYRWREYLERAEPHKLRTFDLMMDRNGYTAPSEWPPAMPPKAESTGPPNSLESDADREVSLSD